MMQKQSEAAFSVQTKIWARHAFLRCFILYGNNNTVTQPFEYSNERTFHLLVYEASMINVPVNLNRSKLLEAGRADQRREKNLAHPSSHPLIVFPHSTAHSPKSWLSTINKNIVPEER